MRRWHKLLAQTLRDLSFAPAGRTRSVYILGMHRSGTSALTGVLADHGLHLVDAVERDHVNASASNPAGNLEDRRVRDVNEGLLTANGGSWDRPAPIRRIPYLLRARAAQIKRQMTQLPRPSGLKDPRTVLCWELWRDADADLVGTFRHPANVVASLIKPSKPWGRTSVTY